jgi:HSP20 family protein
MKLIKYDTFFNDPWSELDRLFEQSLPELYNWAPTRMGLRGSELPMDVYETDNDRVIRLEIPGVRKGDLQLELENAVLSLSAKRQDTVNGEKRSVEMSRSITVGDDVDTDQINASLQDGILTVRLPKKEPARTRQITIE